jgi:hypothetical protein
VLTELEPAATISVVVCIAGNAVGPASYKPDDVPLGRDLSPGGVKR